MNWSPWPSIKTTFQLAFLALMESAWIVGLGALLSSLGAPLDLTLPYSSLGVAGVWLAGAVPLALLLRRKPLLAWLLAALAGIVAIYAELATRFGEANPLTFLPLMPVSLSTIVVGVATLAWVRGALAGMQSASGLNELMGAALFTRFRLGLLLLGTIVLGSLMLDIAAPGTLLSKQVGGLILSFLVFALINLAWGNLEETTIETANRAAQSSRPRPLTWLMGLGVVVVAVLIMGGVLGGAANSPLGVLLSIIATIALLVVGLFTFVLGIIGGLFAPVVSFIIGALRTITNPTSQSSTQQKHNSLTGLADFLKGLQAAVTDAETTKLVSFWVAIIILIIVGVWLFAYFGVRRMLGEPKAQRAAADTTRVSFGSWALLWQQLRAWLAGLWQALLKRLGLWRQPVAVGVGEVAQWSGAEGQRLVSIRQIYRRFQRVAARAGQPRRAPATPREYLAQLQAAYADLPPAAATLTQTYVAARYGNVAPTEAQVSAANAALTEVEQFFAARQGKVGS